MSRDVEAQVAMRQRNLGQNAHGGLLGFRKVAKGLIPNERAIKASVCCSGKLRTPMTRCCGSLTVPYTHSNLICEADVALTGGNNVANGL